MEAVGSRLRAAVAAPARSARSVRLEVGVTSVFDGRSADRPPSPTASSPPISLLRGEQVQVGEAIAEELPRLDGRLAATHLCSHLAHDRTTYTGTGRHQTTRNDTSSGISCGGRATLGSGGRKAVGVRVSPLAPLLTCGSSLRGPHAQRRRRPSCSHLLTRMSTRSSRRPYRRGEVSLTRGTILQREQALPLQRLRPASQAREPRGPHAAGDRRHRP
jgi:hypothetical protein